MARSRALPSVCLLGKNVAQEAPVFPPDPIRHTPITWTPLTDPLGHGYGPQVPPAGGFATGPVRASNPTARQRPPSDAQRAEIAELASELVRSRSDSAVQIIEEVQIPRRGFRSPSTGLAAVELAWPIGELRFTSGQAAVRTSGEVFLVDERRPSVELTRSMRWNEPAVRTVYLTEQDHAEQVLRALRAALAQDAHVAAPRPPVAGRPLTRKDWSRINDARSRIRAIDSYRQDHVPLYGTLQKPLVHGRPTRRIRRIWQQLEADSVARQRYCDLLRGLGQEAPPERPVDFRKFGAR